MIKKNDVLIFGNYLGKGDDYALMLAREDEVTSSKLPMVSVINLNTNLPLLPENFYEAKYFKIVGHAHDGDALKIASAMILRMHLPLVALKVY